MYRYGLVCPKSPFLFRCPVCKLSTCTCAMCSSADQFQLTRAGTCALHATLICHGTGASTATATALPLACRHCACYWRARLEVARPSAAQHGLDGQRTRAARVTCGPQAGASAPWAPFPLTHQAQVPDASGAAHAYGPFPHSIMMMTRIFQAWPAQRHLERPAQRRLLPGFWPRAPGPFFNLTLRVSDVVRANGRYR